MILSTFTFVHVLISRIAIFAGLVVVYGLFTGKRLDGWTALFVWTTVATSVTGFLFPFPRFMPSHALGIISLVVLAVVTYARYGKHVAGSWRGVYTVTAVTALYLNVLCVDRAGVPKGAGAESFGADAV